MSKGLLFPVEDILAFGNVQRAITAAFQTFNLRCWTSGVGREPTFRYLFDSYLLNDRVQSVTCLSTLPEYRLLMRPARGIVGHKATFPC